MSYVQGNAHRLPDIQGLSLREPREAETPFPQTTPQAGPDRQEHLSRETAEIMEEIYGDLFHRAIYSDILKDPQSGSWIGVEGQLEATTSFQELTNSALYCEAQASTLEVVTALRATYWTATHTSGYDFYGPSTVVPSTEAERQCHARASILMSEMSRSSGPPASYQAMHAIAAQWTRYHHVAAADGWKTLSILLYSPQFRSFVKTAEQSQWERLLACIAENTMSLQLLGNFYCQEWVEAMEAALPEGVDLLTEDEKKSYPGDRHNWRVPLDKNARAFEQISPPSNATEATNQHYRSPQYWGSGETAFSVERPCPPPSAECEFIPENWRPARVELIATAGMGTGVRALQRFKKDRFLREYLGELYISSAEGDEEVGPGGDCNIYIPEGHHLNQAYEGHWIRFIGHSFNANCRAEYVEYGGNVLSLYRVVKDIQMFEEVTTDYGYDCSQLA